MNAVENAIAAADRYETDRIFRNAKAKLVASQAVNSPGAVVATFTRYEADGSRSVRIEVRLPC